MRLDITVLNNRLHDFVNIETDIETLDSECTFAEGPVWNPDGFYLFSDISRNAIYKMENGKKDLYLVKSGCVQQHSFLSEQIGSNGLAYDTKGQLFICQHGNGAVVTYSGGALAPVIIQHENKRFNSPNDLVIGIDGAVYFSDPPYGLFEQKLRPGIAQSKARIYCYRNDELKIVSEAYQYPNGVTLSPDGSKLYTCSNKPYERFVQEFDAQTLSFIGTVAAENGDGIKCDFHGNIYLCAKEGIIIIDKNGLRLGIIKLPAIAANFCWGGPRGNHLFITAREHIYLVKNFLYH